MLCKFGYPNEPWALVFNVGQCECDVCHHRAHFDANGKVGHPGKKHELSEPVKVKLYLRMEYTSQSLEETERLLIRLRALTHAHIFKATVRLVDQA